MDKYIIALDLDDTLLDSHKNCSQRTVETLAHLQKMGFVIVLSSARGHATCREIVDLLHADYVCSQSGNMITNKYGEILYKNTFSKENVRDFVNTFSKYTDEIYIDSENGLYGKLMEYGKYWGVIDCSLQELVTIEAFKLCIVSAPYYKEEIYDYCKARNYICRSMRGVPMELISPEKSDKYYALEKILEIENVDLDHLIVFGDDFSDLLSIQKAKYGVAVANAREEVLKEAKYITQSNDEDGVATFLQKYFLDTFTEQK